MHAKDHLDEKRVSSVTSAYIYIYIYIHTYIYIYICMHTHTYAGVRTGLKPSVVIHMYTGTHTHKYTQVENSPHQTFCGYVYVY